MPLVICILSGQIGGVYYNLDSKLAHPVVSAIT